MPTLDELMADVLGAPSQEQTKVASAKPATTQEIDQVLESLGLGEAGAVKTASEELNDNGGNMKGSLTDLLYKDIMGEEEEAAAATAEPTKTAAEATTTEDEISGDAAFGTAAGHYFNAAYETYLDKVAADLISEGKSDSVQPMAHLPGGSAVSKSLGLGGADPHVAVNHKDGLKHEPIAATTKNHGAYDESLKEKAAILRRIKGQGQLGTKKV